MNPTENGTVLRAGVASFVLAGGAAAATVLANRRGEAQSLASLGSALAISAALFAAAGIAAASRFGSRPQAPQKAAAASVALEAAALERLRALVGSIGQTAQVGTVGDERAAEYAFAMIARHASECAELIGRIETQPRGVQT